jgi:hypothetical protein
MTHQNTLSPRAVLFKNDSARSIDRVIDYFGETGTSPARRNLWLISRRGRPRRRRGTAARIIRSCAGGVTMVMRRLGRPGHHVRVITLALTPR